jgi:hypothetical protein
MRVCSPQQERQEALFEDVKDICTILEALDLQAKQKGFQSIADLLRKLEISNGVSLAAILRGKLATVEEAENGKATLNTLWNLELELVDAYDHLADFRPQVSAVSDEEYQVKFERLQTLLKGLIHELCMLPSPKHVSRICLIFKPDVASTTRSGDDDTEFDLTYELPSTVITDKGGDREHERLELVHWRGMGLSVNSTSEDMSVELRKLLHSVPWTARF